jgi:hypothetical protein
MNNETLMELKMMISGGFHNFLTSWSQEQNGEQIKIFSTQNSKLKWKTSEPLANYFTWKHFLVFL